MMKTITVLCALSGVFWSTPCLSEVYRLREGDLLSITYKFPDHVLPTIPIKSPNSDEMPIQLTIPPGGVITLPFIGEVVAAGRTVKDVQEDATSKLIKRYRYAEVLITLSSLQPRFYSIIGEVRRGGQYPLPPGLTLREAIASAEGFPQRPERLFASIFRGGKLHKEFDLYNVGVSDDPAGAEKIEAGDVISVQTKRQLRVWVAGLAVAPGERNIETGRTLRQLVAQAAVLPGEGVEGTQRREEVIVSLSRNGKEILRSSLFDVDSGRASDLELQDGDFITISPREKMRVWVVGKVPRTGQYDLPVGATVLQALAVSGGPDALGTYKDVLLLRQGITRTLDVSRTSPTPEDKTLTLEAGDILFVGANTRRIAILGEVRVPGVHYLTDDLQPRVSDALGLAGGLTRRGPATRVAILRMDANGNVERIPVNFSLFLNKGDESANPFVLPGDVVMVGETNRIEIQDIINATLGLLGLRNLVRG